MSETHESEHIYDQEAEVRTNGRIPDYQDLELPYAPEDEVLSCSKIESGLRLGDDGIRACCMGAIVSPLFWEAKEASGIEISNSMVQDRRIALFKALNDKESGNISCKRCDMVKPKAFKDVNFSELGHVNLAHYSMCNLRCNFCGFTQHNIFTPPQYDALSILKQFKAEDVQWDSFVDLNGGEPTLLKDLDEYIEYFATRGIRILLYTNAVRYSQVIYEGVKNGTITWLITSLDAGTPSSFETIKGRGRYNDVLENLTRYAKAGSEGLGNLAVKYIFSDQNTSDDDVTGFVYAMLAIRPQKVWLTFDFFPLADLYEGQEAVGVYDYSKHIAAYVKMFLLFKKHGLEPAHFAKTHLASVMQAGRDLITAVEEGIAEGLDELDVNNEALFIPDFRLGDQIVIKSSHQFSVNPLSIVGKSGLAENWDLHGKRILLAPAYNLTTALLDEPEIKAGEVLGFLDRSPVLHSKDIQGLGIFPYDKLPELKADVILVAAPEQHQAEILQEVYKYVSSKVIVAYKM